MPPYSQTLVDNMNIKIGASDINVLSSVANLGVRRDRNIKMTTQTSHLMTFCVYQLNPVNNILASLDVQVTENVENAICKSKLDNGNYLLAGITRPQRLQISAARCALMRPSDFSAKDMLCELYWFPVRKHSNKLFLLTYKTLNGSAPEYIVNQLQDHCPTRAVHYAGQNPLSDEKDSYKDWRSFVMK